VASQSSGGPYQFVLVDFDPNTTPAAVRAAIERAAAHEPACHPADADPPCLFVAPARPGDISSYATIQSTPFALAGMLSLLALALMAYTLVTSVRRRRRDLAVLKTLGFRRGQISSSVAWQASVLATIAGVIGLPLGIIAGRWAWTVFAQQLGVPPSPVVPVGLILLAIPVGLLVANLIAWLPGRIAARTPAAVVLRSE
jgi:putative ABC transport system permease protein